MDGPDDKGKEKLRGRDALTLRLFGTFFIAFGGLVWAAMFWEQPASGRVVNFVAGLVLVSVGVFGHLLGKRMTPPRDDD